MCVYIAERMYYCLITHVRMCKRDGGWDGGCGGVGGGCKWRQDVVQLDKGK